MLRPAAMQRVSILMPREAVDSVLARVASLAVLHVVDLPSREEWASVLRGESWAEQRRARRDALRSVAALLRFYAPPPAPRDGEPALPAGDLALRQVSEWAAEMEDLRGERTRLQGELERLEQERRELAALAPSGAGAEQLRAMRLLHTACGWLPLRELERLEETLAQIPHRVVEIDARGDQRLVLAFCRAQERDVLARALQGLGFQPLRAIAAEGVQAAPVEQRLQEVREALGALEARFQAQRLALAEPLARARDALARDALLLDARASTAHSEAVAVLAGWIPASRVAALERAVSALTRGRCHLIVEEPESIDRVLAGSEPVPILFRNPWLLRPFERLTAAFGAPRWRELDPTPIVAVAFWLMFGWMFGDVGHGATLAAIGLGIMYRAPRYRLQGMLLAQCGAAAIVFGFAYGTVFGVKHWLPALWMRPMDDVPRMLIAGACVGLVLLSLAFALALCNAALRKDWRAALLGTHGLCAALTYWIAAALALRWIITGDVGIGAGLAAVVLGAPLALLWVARVPLELREARAARNPSGGPVAALLAGAVEVLDVVVSSIANTVSFARLAAFAVSHAGLLLAVFAMADAVASAPGGTLWGALVLVVGNVIVIALEGLIVSIQGARLVYYEFFSRFYEGTGIEYEPLRLALHPVEEGSS